MYKLKTNKSSLKRYKKTKQANFLCRHAFKGHLLAKKSNAQKRKLSKLILINNSDTKSIKLMLPYL